MFPFVLIYYDKFGHETSTEKISIALIFSGLLVDPVELGDGNFGIYLAYC